MILPRRERHMDWPLTLLAVVTASLATRFVERLKSAEANREQTQHDVDMIRCDVESLRAELTSNGASDPGKLSSEAVKVRSRRRTDFTAERLREK